MSSGNVGDRGGHAGQELDLVIGDRLSEADDTLVLFVCKRLVGELFEAGD